MRACRLARLAQGVRRPASGMGRVPPSSHGAPCALSARRVLPVPAGRAPMPPAPHRLPAGWPVPRSKSQPAGRLEGLLRRGGRRHASARSAPVPARERGPGRGGRSAGHSGRSCTPVRKILHAWSSGAGAQRQGTSGRPPKRPACLTCSKNSAKHGRRSAAGGWRHLGKRVGPACARRRRTLPAVAARKSTMLQRGTSSRRRADGRPSQPGRRTDGQPGRRTDAFATGCFTRPVLQMFLKQLQVRHSRHPLRAGGPGRRAGRAAGRRACPAGGPSCAGDVPPSGRKDCPLRYQEPSRTTRRRSRNCLICSSMSQNRSFRRPAFSNTICMKRSRTW